MKNQDQFSKNSASLYYDIIKLLWNKYFFLIKVIAIGFIVGLIISYSIPPLYTSEASISPEISNGQTSNGSLISTASSLLGGNIATGSDALNLSLTNEIITSTPFLLEVLDFELSYKEETINLSTYLEQTKTAWWNHILKIPSNILSLFTKETSSHPQNNNNKSSIISLDKKLKGKIDLLRRVITSTTDDKSGITKIQVTLQDPELSAQVADKTISLLQEYISKYKTRKAQEDLKYIKHLYDEQKAEYIKLQQKYASFVDSNRNLSKQSTIIEENQLKNEVAISYQIYNQISLQLQSAKAKVQEVKPVFSVLEPVILPLSPSSPKKILITIGSIILFFAGGVTWLLLTNIILKKK